MAQGSQAVLPASFWNLPRSQMVHAAVVLEYVALLKVPASHGTQRADEPKFWVKPSGQGRQAVMPTLGAYVPAPHRGHEPTGVLSEYEPAEHSRQPSVKAPAGLKRPIEQGVQAAMPSSGAAVNPVQGRQLGPAVPGGHGVHDTALDGDDHPTGHGVHSPIPLNGW
jgi:hypothetical protein